MSGVTWYLFTRQVWIGAVDCSQRKPALYPCFCFVKRSVTYSYTHVSFWVDLHCMQSTFHNVRNTNTEKSIVDAQSHRTLQQSNQPGPFPANNLRGTRDGKPASSNIVILHNNKRKRHDCTWNSCGLFKKAILITNGVKVSVQRLLCVCVSFVTSLCMNYSRVSSQYPLSNRRTNEKFPS
jgi:hypothetical protein